MFNSVYSKIGAAFGRLSQSLRVQLLFLVLLTLFGAIGFNLYDSFWSADATAKLVTDRTLLASARVIAEAVRVDEGGNVQVDVPPAALEMFDTGFGDRVFYQVITVWGNLVSGFPDLPLPAAPARRRGSRLPRCRCARPDARPSRRRASRGRHDLRDRCRDA